MRPDVEWAADELPEAEPHYTRIELATTGSLGLSLEGWKRYELSNHLGNVLSVINDRKSYVDNDEDGVADYYLPAILSATDYYPFGMAMAGRTFSTPDYRYGFNGKEKDTDINGDLTHYDYGFRIYNAGIGKFLSVDPLSPDYPWYTPYQFAGNKPIWAIDLDGLEEVFTNFSPIQSTRIKAALDSKNYEEVYRIINYGLNCGFVDECGNNSNYIYRRLEEEYGHYDWLYNNSATTLWEKDNDSNITLFYSIEKNSDGNIVMGHLGQINWKEYEKEINSKRLRKWNKFMEDNDYPSEYWDEWRQVNTDWLNDKKLPNPPTDDKIVDLPMFDTRPWAANRSNQANDFKQIEDFVNDYKENPEKYKQATAAWVKKYFGEHMRKRYEDNTKQTEKSNIIEDNDN